MASSFTNAKRCKWQRQKRYQWLFVEPTGLSLLQFPDHKCVIRHWKDLWIPAPADNSSTSKEKVPKSPTALVTLNFWEVHSKLVLFSLWQPVGWFCYWTDNTILSSLTKLSLNCLQRVVTVQISFVPSRIVHVNEHFLLSAICVEQRIYFDGTKKICKLIGNPILALLDPKNSSF